MSQTWNVTMLKSVHLVGEEESEDLYGGFEEDYNPAYDTEVCCEKFFFLKVNRCV